MRFLVVQDRAQGWESIKQWLQKSEFAGARLVEASDEATFRRALEEGPFDLVLTDCELHWADGLALLRQVKARFPDLPVVMVTAAGNKRAAAEGVRAGLGDYLLDQDLQWQNEELEVQSEVLRSGEQALREQEHLLSLTMDSTPALISYIGADCRYRRVNQSYERWFGRRAEDLQGRTLWDVLGQAAWEAIRPYVERVLAGETVTFEQEVPFARGGTRWVHATYTPDRDEGGKVRGFIAHVLDINERRCAEAQLQRQANELDAVFHALDDAVVVFDATGRIVRSNPAFRALFGIDPVVLDRSAALQDLVIRRTRRGAPVTLAELPSSRALAGVSVAGERYLVTNAQGRQVCVIASAAPLLAAGRVVGAVAAFHDVTEIEESRYLSELLNWVNTRLISSPTVELMLPDLVAEIAQGLGLEVGVLAWHEQGRWAVRHVYGLPEDTVGRAFLDQELELTMWAVEHREVLAVDDTWADSRFVAETARLFGLRAVLVIPLVLQEQAIGVLVLASSSAPVLFRPTHADFARKLGAAFSLAADNSRLYEQSRRDAEMKTTLLREVNHRVKNNLAAIIGLLYAQMDGPEAASHPEYQEVVREVTHRVEGLSIVHGMLSATQWAPLRLDDLAQRIIHSALELVPVGRVAVEITASPVRVSPDQAHTLALIVNELALNVIKHALGPARTIQVSLDIGLAEEYAVLTFRDNGPGYPEAVMAGQQAGVGLSLLRNLVRQNLRGQLALRNEGGAVVEIRFPVGEKSRSNLPRLAP